MKRINNFLVLILIIFLLTCCNNSTNPPVHIEPTEDNTTDTDLVERYTIIWKNYDGTILETDTNIEKGSTPTYDGQEPSREEDTNYVYSFCGWYPDIQPVTADKVYTAQFNSTKKQEFEYSLNGDSRSYTLVRYNGTNDIVSIPDTYNDYPITGIRSYAFYNSLVKKIIIANNVTNIEKDALAFCPQLEEVNFDIYHINSNIFNNVNSVKTVVFGEMVETIDDGALSELSLLENIVFYRTNKMIGRYFDKKILNINVLDKTYCNDMEMSNVSYNGASYYVPVGSKENIWFYSGDVEEVVDNEFYTYLEEPINTTVWSTYVYSLNISNVLVPISSWKVPKYADVTFYKIPKTLSNITVVSQTKQDCNGMFPNISANITYKTSDGDIELGLYPQSRIYEGSITKELDKMVGDLPTSDNYCSWTPIIYPNIITEINNPFIFYKDVTYKNNKFRAVYFLYYTLQYVPTGDVVVTPSESPSDGHGATAYQYDNGYYIKNIYWFRYEPIKWNLISKSNDKKILVSNRCLDYKPFDSTLTRDYGKSWIRTWLGDYFYSFTFSDEEQSILLDHYCAVQKNDCYDGSSFSATNNTSNRVFLLSYKEWKSGTNRPEICPTDYACCMGAQFTNPWSLLRTQHCAYNNAGLITVVNNSGYSDWYTWSNRNTAIMPAIEILS